MIAVVGNNKIAFAVKRNTTVACAKLSVAVALPADGADAGAVAHMEHLHSSVTVIKNGHIAFAVDRNAIGIVELPVTALAADGANMGAVGVPQHLHAMIAMFRHDDVTNLEGVGSEH